MIFLATNELMWLILHAFPIVGEWLDVCFLCLLLLFCLLMIEPLKRAQVRKTVTKPSAFQRLHCWHMQQTSGNLDDIRQQQPVVLKMKEHLALLHYNTESRNHEECSFEWVLGWSIGNKPSFNFDVPRCCIAVHRGNKSVN